MTTKPNLIRVQTSFQDTPDGVHFFVLLYNGRDLEPQLDALGLKDGDTVLLWEPDCPGYTVEAILLVDFLHPMMFERKLWAKASS